MDKKILRWNFVFQYGWVITNIINSILLLPLYIKFIDTNTLGVWLATSGILYWMTIIDPGVGEVLQQKIAELRGKNEHGEIGNTVGSGLFASMLILFLSVVLGIVVYFLLGTIINKDVSQYPNLSNALFITIISTGLSLVSFTLTGINQGLHNSAQVAISSLTANLLFLLVNILFLYMGHGVMSIAIANLSRAIYINLYNFISLKKVLGIAETKIDFNVEHFKKFIKIFSFTSLSKIITGIANSMDMLVLARFVSPALVTVYEINKRPISLTNSLIGRHSVALMPLISHAKGMNEKASVVPFIGTQFKLYVYATVFVLFMYAINYFNLINLWVGPDKFFGNNLLVLMLLYSFFYLIGYFMSNISYALGDIKVNSFYQVAKNLLFIILVFLGAKYYGMIGTLAVSFGMALLFDFFFFIYRVKKLGYLSVATLKTLAAMLIPVITVCFFIVWMISMLINMWFPSGMLLLKMIVSSTIFTLCFVTMLLMIDVHVRSQVKQLVSRLKFSFS